MSTQAGLSGVKTPWTLLARGDLESVFAGYNVPIRNAVGRMLPGEPELADEVAQQVCVRLLEQMLDNKLNRQTVRGHLRNYIRTVCRNAVRDQLRRLGRQRKQETVTDELPEIDVTWEQDCRAAVSGVVGEAVRGVLETAIGRGLRGSSLRQLLELLIERADENPENSQAMAARLTELTGRDWRDDSYRRLLRQVRVQVAEELTRRVWMELGEEATRADLIDQLRRDQWLELVQQYAPHALEELP